MLYKVNIKEFLILSIIFLIGFQAFPVIKIGGSFKIYELIALSLLLINVITINNFYFSGKIGLAAFCFFVLSPIISYLYSNIVIGYPSGFYHRYPQVDSFKFNYYIFPILQLIYMFFNFIAINSIMISEFLYENLNRILKIIVCIGTFISIYSFFAMGVKDVILLLPSFIQNKSYYSFRSSGFSQEPSFYILYQGWICFINWFTKPLFKKYVWYVLIFINVISLLLTFSSSMAGFFLIILSSVFIFKNRFVVRLRLATIIALIIALGYCLVLYFNLVPFFQYIFVSKVTGFFSTPTTTTDSGSYRSYTSAIGLEIFKDHWLAGVGVGNSTYYMYIYEFKMGIVEFLNVLEPGIFPQNTFSSVLADQGIIGGLCLFVFLFMILRKFWLFRNQSDYNKMFLMGTLFNIIVMLTIAPVYSLYLWIFIALGLCYVRHHNITISKSTNSVIINQ